MRSFSKAIFSQIPDNVALEVGIGPDVEFAVVVALIGGLISKWLISMIFPLTIFRIIIAIDVTVFANDAVDAGQADGVLAVAVFAFELGRKGFGGWGRLVKGWITKINENPPPILDPNPLFAATDGVLYRPSAL